MEQSNVSGDWTSRHWTDEQLIAERYGVGPADGHLAGCAECRARSALLVGARIERERIAPIAEDVGLDFLAAQRRTIYARLAQPSRIGFRRAVSVAAALVVIGAGVVTYQDQHPAAVHHDLAQTSLSDAQLATEVAEMGQDSDPARRRPFKNCSTDGKNCSLRCPAAGRCSSERCANRARGLPVVEQSSSGGSESEPRPGRKDPADRALVPKPPARRSQ